MYYTCWHRQVRLLRQKGSNINEDLGLYWLTVVRLPFTTVEPENA